MTLNGHYTLNCFCQSKFKICLFTYTDSAMERNHSHLCHLLELCNFVTCFSRRRFTTCMSSTIEQLNKVLTIYCNAVSCVLLLTTTRGFLVLLAVKTPRSLTWMVTIHWQEAQLPLRNNASAIHFFVAKLLSIAVMTYIYIRHVRPMNRLIYYAHNE